MYSIMRNHWPSESNDEHMIKFLFYVNWQIKQRFEKHIDSYLAVTDLKNMGKSNVNIG